MVVMKLVIKSSTGSGGVKDRYGDKKRLRYCYGRRKLERLEREKGKVAIQKKLSKNMITVSQCVH